MPRAELLAGLDPGSEAETGSEDSGDKGDTDLRAMGRGTGNLEDLDYDAMLAGGEGPGSDSEGGAGAGAGKSAAPRRALAAVEDDYLKLDEMEAFLLDAERAAVEAEDNERGEDDDGEGRGSWPRAAWGWAGPGVVWAAARETKIMHGPGTALQA